MEEISLIVENQTFKVKRALLCEHSDYFRAMFSGNYVENELQEISINVVDAMSMKIIIQYMNIGLIDLSEYPLSAIADLAVAANFLQITELIKQIEYTLEIQTSVSNWMETITIAENSSFKKLEQLTAAFGLLSFSKMKPESIPSLQKLFWYLSHSYLDAKNELDVFKFGLHWILHNETGADALLILMGCLNLERVEKTDFLTMKELIKDYENSLASKVIDCLYKVSCDNPITKEIIIQSKQLLCEQFTTRVYSEVLKLVNENCVRKLKFTPTVPVWMIKNGKPEVVPHIMYAFTEDNGFHKWIEVADKNLWGWNVVGWGPTKMVVCSGESGRGTGVFMKDVKVYDTIKADWIHHGVELPSQRHGGVGIIDDTLYIVGGVGGFRVVLDSVLAYNLKEKTFRKVAKLPDQIQNPSVCVHNNKLYAAGHKNIYRYEDYGDRDTWVTVLSPEIRTNCMISFKDYIYCTQNYFSHLYRFRPDVDDKLIMVTYFTNPVADVCDIGDRLIAFTTTMCGQSDIIAVEEFTDNEPIQKPKVLWSQSNTPLKMNDVAGSCALVMDVPPLNPEVSKYAVRYLKCYWNQIKF